MSAERQGGVGLGWQASFFAVICLLFAASPLRAQPQAQAENFTELDLPGLAARVDAAYPGRPAEAIPYMIEIRTRLKGAMTEDYRRLYIENLFMLGLAHMEWYSQTKDPVHLTEAIVYWDEFVADCFEDPRHPLAMLNRADCHFGLESWEAAAKAYLDVLRVYSLQLSDEDLAGLLGRLVRSARESGMWEPVVPVLWKYAQSRAAYEIRLLCLNALFDRYLEQEDLPGLLRLVVLINEDRAFRYDLGINLRLLNAGDRFEEDESFLEAGMLFSMVLPLEVLLHSVEDRLIELEERLFNRRFIASQKGALEAERTALRAERIRLAEAPAYTANLRWRQARVMRLMNRTFEAYFAFRRLIAEYPQHTHIEQFRYAAFLQGLECRYEDEAVELGEHYLAQAEYLLFEKPVAVRMAGLYLKRRNIDKLFPLADNFVHRFPLDPVAAQMTHTLGQAWFAAGRIDRILETFPYWAEEFPDGAFLESADYWSGMAYLFQGDFERALTVFDNLIRDYPGSVYLTEARFRRGVAYFGLGDYETAEPVFKTWVAEFPEHPLRPEAEVFLGDLSAMDARVEEALEHYRMVEVFNGSQALIDHGYFESAALLLANKRYDEHQALLERYLERYPDSPAGAEAVLQLASAEKEQGRIAAAFTRYEAGLRRFGNRPDSDQVDAIIEAWWETDRGIRAEFEGTAAFVDRLLSEPAFRRTMLYDRIAQIGYFREEGDLPEELAAALGGRTELRERLMELTPKEAPPAGWSPMVLNLSDLPGLEVIVGRVNRRYAGLPDEPAPDRLAALRESALEHGEAALALRLLRVLASRSAMQVGPGDLPPDAPALASPATLVWIGSLIMPTDPERAREHFLRVVERAPESEAAVEALFHLAAIEREAGRHGEAAAYYRRVLEEHPVSERAPEACLREGDALRDAGRFEAALASYAEVLEQREWRGEAWAEATFKMGEAFLAAGETGKAQGFFERTYLAYSGYVDWAARAVLESGKLLESLGEMKSARETYNFFLSRPQSGDSPLHETILQRFEALNPAPNV